MMRRLAPLALLVLAACAPPVPDSAAGVGFGDYRAYQAERERALRNSAVVPPPVSVRPPEGAGAASVVAPPPAVPSAVPPAPLPAPGSVPLSALADNPAISDEQSFDAVSARETIESDAERLARLRAEYQLIAPAPPPQRPGGAGPNIVEYALATTNAPGQAIYRRSGFNAEARFQRACGRFATPDEAQRAFLGAGGPESDRLGLDPDGDGFACFWDPRPFRAARGG